MDRQYSWKKTEDIEIDLADLLRRLFRQWKRIAVCALATAMLLGGAGLIRSRNVSQSDELEMEEKSGDDLTEEEEQAVADAVRLEGEIRQQEAYLENSVLMQLDPYHKAKYVMLYCIDQADSWELPQITESYLSFVINGGAADALAEYDSWCRMDKSCLAELICAYEKTKNFPYQVIVDDMEEIRMPGVLFYVEVTGKNAKEAEKMAKDMQKVLNEYSAEAKEKSGNHKLSLLTSEQSVTADSSLQVQQRDKKAALSANRTNWKAMTDAFNERQMSVYRETAGLKDETSSEQEGLKDEQEVFLKLKQNMKYIVFGFVGGIFLYGCVFSCWYIFNGVLKSAEEMKRLYTFPFFGAISSNGGTGQVINRIRLGCKKNEAQKFYAVSDVFLDTKEKESLKDMARQLKDCGIDMISAENVIADSAVWDDLTQAGNVLMVCKIGTTTYRMIDDAMNFYLENGIAVMGAVAFIGSD